MIDPLSCLREYAIKKKPIVEKSNLICFGEYCWPKSVKTNYQIFNKQQDAAKEYYTLECLLFFLNNSKLNHVEYVNFAKKIDVPFIRRPDRKKLLAYLTGEISTSPSINTNAPVVYPTKIKLGYEKEVTNVDKDSNFQKYSIHSSAETNVSRNEKQSPCLPRVKQEDHGNVHKKQRTENSFALSSSDTSNSRNNVQKNFNLDHNSSSEKQVSREQDEINTKPSAEELLAYLEGEQSTSPSIDTNAPVVCPSKLKLACQKEITNRYFQYSLNLSRQEALRKQSKSGNEDQNNFNHNYNSSSEKQVSRVQDEIDTKPSAEQLLAYLAGEKSTSPSINTNAPVVCPTKTKPGYEKEVTDVDKDSNFQNSFALSCCEEVRKPSKKPGYKDQNNFNSSSVKPGYEKEVTDVIKYSNFQEYSIHSSAETNISRNEKQFPSLQRVKQEDHGNVHKKQRIENSFALSSSDTCNSRNEVQKNFNLEHNSSSEKPVSREQDEIDIKPSAEELSILFSSRKNISPNEEFSTLQRVKQEKGQINCLEKQRNELNRREIVLK